MNNKESNFIKTKTTRNTSKNGKNSIEEKDFDLPHPAFDRSRKQREINNKIILEILNSGKLLSLTYREITCFFK